MSDLNVAVIGCGRVARSHHLPILRRLPGVTVRALADTDPDRLEALRSSFGVEHAFSDSRRAIEHPDIDVVAVCVPVQQHAEMALHALAHNKHLYVEKPMAFTLEECDRMMEAERSSGTRCTVGFNMRSHRLVRRLRELLRQGIIGAPELVQTTYTTCIAKRGAPPAWRTARADGGGTFFENAVHHVDLWRYLLGSDPDDVFALATSRERDDEVVTLCARMANGAHVSTSISDGSSNTNELSIFGNAGSLHCSCYRIDGLAQVSTAGVPGGLQHRLSQWAEVFRDLPAALDAVRHGGDWQNSYYFAWQQFRDAMATDTPLRTTFEDGRKALALIQAAQASASSGEPVPVEPVQCHADQPKPAELAT